jgi:dUTP pyrophosphatase
MNQLRLFADDFDEAEYVINNRILKVKCDDLRQFNKAHPTDAGYDIISAEDINIAPSFRQLIRTGLYLAIPEGYVGIIKSRSGTAVNAGIEHGAGVIDSDYRGEVKVLLYNFGFTPYKVQTGDRIAQMLILPIPKMFVHRVSDLDNTVRGEGGFGSTGQ